ncbi:MAG: 3-phosphoshikimate 1-carboxyvinyltransferase [Acholeplasmatales bacterium]|nr:3-phosphoshikimate 1-carboxyvinyltransferase [Acholeplasmatales bacterium]
MNVLINPKKLHGDVIVPSSKSISHRAIIAASLSKGTSVISNIILSEDIKATINAVKALGAKVEILDDKVVIEGGIPYRKESVIDANESGSTLRFMIPIALTVDDAITFVGNNNLVNRPLDAYFDIFNKQGIKYSHKDAYLPLMVEGKLKSGIYEIPGNVSSQYITGLLFALPLLDGNSVLRLTTSLESKGYVDLTLDVLARFGIEIINNDYKEFIINGNQKYKPCDYMVESDYSQAAFFLVLAALGNDIKLYNMNQSSLQGDKKILADLEAFGCKVNMNGDCITVDANNLEGATIDFSQTPDLGPAVAILGALSNGKTKFVNASRLRLKESDRISCMVSELEKMGVEVIEHSDGMTISGIKNLKGATIDSHNDHRIAMAFAVAASCATSPVKILNAECVNKSYPDFWNVYESLGGEITYEK